MPARPLLAVGVLGGIWGLLSPLFGPVAPESASIDFINHVALVAGAVETLRTVGGVPISSDALVPGIEYPYFLFGNAGFYIPAAFVSFLLGIPAYLGMSAVLAAAFALGACGAYALAHAAGVNRYLAVALGLLYAAGPYHSVNLFVRVAFPEYVAWQVMPVLLLVMRRALGPDAGGWAMLAGSLALAAPFYLHKLIAPHMAMVLAALALNGAPFTRRTVVRLGVVGVVAIFLSVPAWYFLARGLAAEDISAISANQRPWVLNPSWVNLFWPWSQNSLADAFKEPVYGERFALQIGLAPALGFLLALVTLVTRPRLAIARRLPLPLLIFAAYVLLLMNGLNVWNVVPSPLGYIQFTYRLLGVTHLVGFLLLAYALGSAQQTWLPPRSPRLRVAAAGLLVGLATLSTSTYWRPPEMSGIASATIRPNSLFDISHFFPWAGRSNLLVGRAIAADGRLAVPPQAIPIPDGVPSLVLAGAVDAQLFQGSTAPLVIRIYGFSRRGPQAEPFHLTALFRARRGRPYPVQPIHEMIERETRDSRRARSNLTAGRAVALPDVEWGAVRLAETTLSEPGRFELRANLSESIAAIAIECSRAVGVPDGYSGWSSPGVTCASVDVLAVPNEGSEFVQPQEVPAERRTRRAHGGLTVDARDLPPGHYLLPMFHYPFVRVHAVDGARVSTSQFTGRTTIRHPGNVDTYTVSYALEPPLLAALAGLALCVCYAAGERWIRRRARGPSGRHNASTITTRTSATSR